MMNNKREYRMLDTLVNLEKSLFKYENCMDLRYLTRILHPDFMEFGTSGKIYNRNTTIELLQTVTSDRPITIHSATLKQLSSYQWLLHYVSENEESGVISNRTSIWIKEHDYQLYFHQGTKTDKLIVL